MAPLANLNGVSKTLPSITRLPNSPRSHKKEQITASLGTKTHLSECCVHTTRRAAIGLASVLLTGHFSNQVSLAADKDDGSIGWYDELPPDPTVNNMISNEKTGTRSFLKKRLYMANIGVKGSVYRIKKYAFDLLAMADLVAADTLNYVRRYLRLKSTFMFYDFDKVISAVPVDDKQPLTDMANRLFDNFEKLEDASRRKNLSETQSCYQETQVMLHEVMDRMSSLYKTI
ncbi:hypothetical protein L6164_018562 [Bauhinia variegata]|uniref:Uncharacterized protein n=1 Tax=Bauhinia variegata TaxID=167791 RepID=A0ACB9NGF2_BAUVA|nr:hypothetical protein L6164_018562 [Bauhinia variegata]